MLQLLREDLINNSFEEQLRGGVVLSRVTALFKVSQMPFLQVLLRAANDPQR